MEQKEQSERVRVNIYLDRQLVQYVDDFSVKNGISRSGAISVIIAHYKQSMDGMQVIGQLLQEVKKQGTIPPGDG